MLRYINRASFSIVKKTEHPDSNVVMDCYAFRQTDPFNRFKNYFKNANASFDMRNNIPNFKQQQFQDNILRDYNSVVKCYTTRDYRHLYDYVKKDFYKQGFQDSCQERSKIIKFRVRLELYIKCKQSLDPSKFIYCNLARIHSLNLTKMRSIQKWFQIICLFKNAQGGQIINVLQKHEKAKQFKFIKFDL